MRFPTSSTATWGSPHLRWVRGVGRKTAWDQCLVWHGDIPSGFEVRVERGPRRGERKRTGVAEHPEVFDHAGILCGWPASPAIRT